MLEPKEIDNYFHVVKKQPPAKESTWRHTRLVTLIKLALPGLAAVLAATLLIFPSLNDDIREFSLDFAIGQGDIEKLNIEKTTVYITDDKNRVSNFVARQINETSAGSQMFNLLEPEAVLPMEDGEWLSIRSPRGLYDQKTALLNLQNNVEGFYSAGMNIQTTEVFFDFKKSFGYGRKPVTGEGFLGEVSAEGFEFSGRSSTLTFLGKTRIIIDKETLQKEQPHAD